MSMGPRRGRTGGAEAEMRLTRLYIVNRQLVREEGDGCSLLARRGRNLVRSKRGPRWDRHLQGAARISGKKTSLETKRADRESTHSKLDDAPFGVSRSGTSRS